jgi:hypothetical protein
MDALDVGPLLLVGVASPSAVATPPINVLSKAQTFRMPSKTEGKLGVWSTSV